MICFVTDIRNGEPDILRDISHNDLVLEDEYSRTVAIITKPVDGWSHEDLISCDEVKTLSEQGVPLDASLGGEWIGSTEV